MLSYTFSTREKVLIAVLVIGLVVVAWYQLVFLNVQNQMASIDTQITQTQKKLSEYQKQTADQKKMRDAIDAYESQGLEPVMLPEYDNTQNLMAYLHGVLALTKNYEMSFKNPTLSEEDNTVHRTGTVKYECDTYEQARKVAESVAHGPYTCQVDAMSIEAKKSRKSGDVTVKYVTTLQVTFFENKPSDKSDKELDAEEDTAKGQDLSALTQMNKK